MSSTHSIFRTALPFLLATSGCATGVQATSMALTDGWVGEPAVLAPPAPLAPTAPTPNASHAAGELETPAAPPSPQAPPEAPPEPAPRCPPEMTLVSDDVCVDRWEASLVQVLTGGTEIPWTPYESPSHAKVKVRAVSRSGVVPQGYISGEEAQAACETSGKRLCWAEEWEAACRGSQARLYPYGNTRREKVCNDDGRDGHPVAAVHTRLGLPRDRMWYEGMSHPLINQLDDTLTKTGEHESCTNDAGAFDMVGNLHEWIADPDGTFRGGFYMDTEINGEGCDYATTAHPMSYADYSTGFRCCRDADPDAG